MPSGGQCLPASTLSHRDFISRGIVVSIAGSTRS